jgi:Fic family protein
MKPYIPEKLPLKSLDWTKIIRLMGQANYELALYEGILHAIVNPSLLLSPLITKEAVLSSKIEGTQATLEEVLDYQALPRKSDSKTEDIREVLNYRESVRYATEYIKTRPINLNLCKEMHYILLDSVRGKDKARGEFRKEQNWIGSHNCKIEEANYVPPPPDVVMEYCANLEQYIHFDEQDKLVQLAIVHAQFEMIHPFLDGNGRLGRILIPLFLLEKKMLSEPVFYISAYIDNNRDSYYEKLNQISNNNKWEDWINFFLTAIIEQSKENCCKVKEILDLYNETKNLIAHSGTSHFAINALDAIFEQPIFNTTYFIKHSKIQKASAIRILSWLEKQKVLSIKEKGKGRSPSVFVFRKLLDITG